MKRALADTAASVHARLLNHRAETGEDFNFLLQRFAAERFLYRLGQSRHRDNFVLKGATLLNTWGVSAFRPTRDIDFTGYGDRDRSAIAQVFREICGVDAADDGMTFDAGSLTVAPIMDATEYEGVRIKLVAHLGSARVPMQIDVGFGDQVQPPAEEIDYPALLDFPPPRIRGYHREGVVAEKLHAVVVLGERTSRYKDFYDLYVLALSFEFRVSKLAEAVSATFLARQTPIAVVMPVTLTPAFFEDDAPRRMWQAFLDKNSLTNAPLDFAEAGELLMSFARPIWDWFSYGPTDRTWPPGGPWR